MTESIQLIDNGDSLRHLLRRKKVLLLDFDGPICSVFAGLPAPVVADQLRELLAESGHWSIPLAIERTSDPFDVFSYASTLGPDESAHVQAALAAHELEAISTAQPTPHAHEVISKWARYGRDVAVVSNNSRLAVDSYLHAHALSGEVRAVSARESSDPSKLKPSKYLVANAVEALGASAEDCVLVGDSVTDVHAARSAGVAVIGYANKRGKEMTLSAAGADLIVSQMEIIGQSF